MYNLIVIGYSDNSWLSQRVVNISYSRFLEYTKKTLVSEYTNNIPKLFEFPCLIMKEGFDSYMHLCKIERVEYQESQNLRIYFEIIEQDFINFIDIKDHLLDFDINEWEVHRTHWALKEGDLSDLLSKTTNILKEDDELSKSLFEFFSNTLESYNKFIDKHDLAFSGSETNDKEYVKNITEFINKITINSSNEGSLVFYRGHSNCKYELEPSLFRKTPDGDYQYLENENTIYNELLTQNYSEFSADDSTFDRLVRMQHFALPTRLLDISTNPLIALYFACKGNLDKDGDVILIKVEEDKVKYFDSDTATCIANLCKLSFKDKETLSIGETDLNYESSMKKLYHCIKDDKPYFKERIEPKSINEILCIKGKITNLRINAQSGAFLLFGLDASLEDDNEFGFNIKHFLIRAEDKENILAELDALNINDSSLFPYLENSARYISNKFQKR